MGQVQNNLHLCHVVDPNHERNNLPCFQVVPAPRVGGHPALNPQLGSLHNPGPAVSSPELNRRCTRIQHISEGNAAETGHRN